MSTAAACIGRRQTIHNRPVVVPKDLLLLGGRERVVDEVWRASGQWDVLILEYVTCFEGHVTAAKLK